MKRYLILAMAVTFCSAMAAQSRKLTLYFANDSYAITSEERAKLQAWLEQLPGGEYQIEVEAHTDQAASAAYNQKLSQNRANSTRAYLVKAGIEEARILSKFAGESKPLEALADGTPSALNRRVELRYKTLVLKSAQDIIEWERRLGRQEFRLSSGAKQEIKGKQGTSISIPPNAFQLPNGQYVDNSEVTMVLQEFTNFQSALLNGLTTQTSRHENLESGGMFYIEAQAYGQKLELREGMELGVEMPSSNIQSGMTVFYGSQNEAGQVVWQDSEIPFNVKDNIKVNYPDSFLTRLNAISLEDSGSYGMKLSTVQLQMPKRPNMPYPPVKPIPPVEPQKPEGSRPLLVVGGEWKAYEDSMTWFNVYMQGFNRRQAYYERKVNVYHKRMKKYVADSVVYGNEMAAYNAKLESYVQERESALKELNKYIAYTRIKALKEAAEELLLQGQSTVNPRWNRMEFQEQFAELANLNIDLSYLRRLRNPKNNELYYKVTKKGKVEMELVRKAFTPYRGERDAMDWDWYGVFGSGHETSEVGKLLKEVREYMLDWKLKNGIADNSTLQSVYKTSFKRMGYINCDRFSTVPAIMMASHDIYVDFKDAQVTVCVNRLNSILTAIRMGDNHYRIRIPLGEKITVVAMGAKEGKAMYSKEVHQISVTSKPIQLNLKQMELDAVRKDLAKL